MLRRAVIAALPMLTPRRWRDSIAGDLEETRAGALRILAGAVPLLARLWIEELSVARSRASRRSAMNVAFHLRQATRALLQRPGYSALVVLTLAAGIGANAAVFGLANWLMFRPIPGVHEPDHLVTIRLMHPSGGVFTVSHPEMDTLRAHASGMTSIAGSMEAYFDVAFDGRDAERIDGGIVSANYFEVLGVQPAIGRPFSPSDPGVVVSHEYWRNRMSSANIVGRSMHVNGKPLTVLGVAPPGFAGLTRSSSIDVWVPTTLRTTVFPGYTSDPLTNMNAGIYIELAGRLAPGATAAAVQHAMEAAAAELGRVHRRPQRYQTNRFIVDEGLTAPGYERARLGRVFALLLAISAMLLVLACANVANVMVASGSARRAEFATRQALGASRRQVIAGVFVEGLLLACAGGAAAVALASLCSMLLRGTIVLSFIPALGEISLDRRVFAFALAVSAISAIAAGLVPALASTRVDLLTAIRGTTRSVTGGSKRLQRALMIAQVAVSLTLLVGALLVARSVQARRAVDPGFDTAPLLSFSVEPGMHGYEPERRAAFYDTLLAHVRSTPGVQSAALGWSRPFGRMVQEDEVRKVGDTTSEPISAEVFPVSAGYAKTMGLPIVAGREFVLSDSGQKNAPSRVGLLSVSLAERLFGSVQAAIGQQIKSTYSENDPPIEIVGVVRNARLRSAFEPAPDALYLPLGRDASWATVHVRAHVPPATLAAQMRNAVRQSDGALPVFDLMTVRQAMERQMAEEVLVARLTIGVTILAVLLAAIGLYGLLAGSVADRRVEIGIRAALGAAPGRILQTIARDAMRMTMAGAVLGLGAAAWLTRYLENRLYGVERFDPMAFATALVVIALVSLGAALVPARRAARVDPVIALRR